MATWAPIIRSWSIHVYVNAAARSSGGLEPDLAKTLLDKGASPNRPSQGGWTALQAALRKGNEELARLLIEKGAGVSDPGALEYAVRAGLDGIVELLLDLGCDIDATRDRSTPLATAATAATAGRTKVVELLLSRGANTESLSMGEVTALGEIAFDRLVDIAKILLTGSKC
jgi:ankyrin repeat protein